MAASKMAHSLQKAQTPLLCELCESDSKIEWKCLDCDLLMCHKCKVKVHIKVKLANNHTVIARKDIANRVADKVPLPKCACAVHQSQIYCLFCKTCEKAVCPDCISLEHSKHAFESLEKVHDDHVFLLNGFIQTVEEDITKVCLNRREKLKNFNKEQMQHYEKLSRKVRDHEKKIIDNVKSVVEQELACLDLNRKKVENFVSKETIRNEDLLSEMKSLKTKTVETLQSKNLGSVIEMSKTVQKEIKSYDSMKPEVLHFDSPVFQVGDIDKHVLRQMVGKIVNKQKPFKLEHIESIPTNFNSVVRIKIANGHTWVLDIDVRHMNEKIFDVRIEDKIKTLKEYSKISACDLAVLPSGEIILFTVNSPFIMKLESSGNMTAFKNFSPLLVRGLHVTKSGEIIVGLRESGPLFPIRENSKRQMIVLYPDGKQKRLCEYNRAGEKLFSVPYRFAAGSNGNIFVIDWLTDDRDCRIAAVGLFNSIKWTFIPAEKSDDFEARDIVVTNSENLIVATSDIFYILTTGGEHLISYKTKDIGFIGSPRCLEIDTCSRLWVGGHVSGKAFLQMLKFEGF